MRTKKAQKKVARVVGSTRPTTARATASGVRGRERRLLVSDWRSEAASWRHELAEAGRNTFDHGYCLGRAHGLESAVRRVEGS